MAPAGSGSCPAGRVVDQGLERPPAADDRVGLDPYATVTALVRSVPDNLVGAR